MKLAINQEERKSGAAYLLILLALAVGTCAGSIYLSKNWGIAGGEITEYISSLFGNERAATPYIPVLSRQLITIGIIFAMGFFRFGFIVTGAIIIRKGFITGFTAASFVSAYGVRGLLGLLAASPMSVITALLLVLYSAASVLYSVNKNKFEKKFVFSYIFLTIFVISIFCGVLFSESFLATIFMKWFLPEI